MEPPLPPQIGDNTHLEKIRLLGISILLHTALSVFRDAHCKYYDMRGANRCQWLVIGSAELCGTSCMGDYCQIHLTRLRKGPDTIPCQKCGEGFQKQVQDEFTVAAAAVT